MGQRISRRLHLPAVVDEDVRKLGSLNGIEHHFKVAAGLAERALGQNHRHRSGTDAKAKLEKEGEILVSDKKGQYKSKIHRIWLNVGTLLAEVDKRDE